MEFNVILQELRKARGLTQEELAKELYVSRTAISRWESGRGYPGIDLLKAIAAFFDTTVDDLLSPREALALAEEDGKAQRGRFLDFTFGLLDICMALLLFLPFFRERAATGYISPSLLALGGVQPYLKVLYFIFVGAAVLLGILTLALQGTDIRFFRKYKAKLSLLFSLGAVLLFVLSMQPYAAVFALSLLAVKAFLLLKQE